MSTIPYTESSGPRTYFGWQAERVEFMFGLSMQRTLLIAAALVLALWPVFSASLGSGVVAWPLAAVLGGSAMVRVAGRTADEWASSFLSYQYLRLRGLTKFASGPFNPAFARTAEKDAGWDLPGILAPLELLEVDGGAAGSIGVAHHRIDKTFTAVARVSTPGIGLIDSFRRGQRVSSWGSLLAGLCVEGSPITRIQVMQRTVPESGASLRRWDAAHQDPEAPGLAVNTVRTLLATSTLASSRRETFLAFTLDARRAAGPIKSAGGGADGAALVLARHLRAQSSQIVAADLQIEAWLTGRDLSEVIRTAYDPDAARHLAERRANHGAPTAPGMPAGVAPEFAAPSAAVSEPTFYKHCGAITATYWISAFPRTHVSATSLAPVLGEAAHRRAYSMHIQPLPPRVAEKLVMRERMSRSVQVRLRQRTGQIVPEHEQVALERAEQQDAERAAGHGLVRFTALVSVTVTDIDQLPDACAALEADAAAANLECQRVYYAQDTAFAAVALPLGQALPRTRW